MVNPEIKKPETPEAQKERELMEMVDRINSLSTEDIEKIAENLRKLIEKRQRNKSKEIEEK